MLNTAGSKYGQRKDRQEERGKGTEVGEKEDQVQFRNLVSKSANPNLKIKAESTTCHAKDVITDC